MTATIAKLDRILSDLDNLANHFEEAGYEAQSDALDAAADKIEDVLNGLQTLASFGAAQRRVRRGELAHA